MLRQMRPPIYFSATIPIERILKMNRQKQDKDTKINTSFQRISNVRDNSMPRKPSPFHKSSLFGNRKKIRRFKSNCKSMAKRRMFQTLALIILLAILLLLFQQCGILKFPWQADNPAIPVVAGDLFPGAKDAKDGSLSNMTRTEILDQMQKVADAAYFSFKINTEIVFEDGTGMGNVGIENPNYNIYPMVVHIYLGKNGEGGLIYDSGGILPGQHIDAAKLITPMERGTYEALAFLYAYAPDTKVNIFKSTADVKIIIKNETEGE